MKFTDKNGKKIRKRMKEIKLELPKRKQRKMETIQIYFEEKGLHFVNLTLISSKWIRISSLKGIIKECKDEIKRIKREK